MPAKNVVDWTTNDVGLWLTENGHLSFLCLFKKHDIDGKVLLTLKEEDLKSVAIQANKTIGDLKRLCISIKQLQRDNVAMLFELGCVDLFTAPHFYGHHKHEMPSTGTNNEGSIENEFYSASVSEDGHASHLPPEIWKTFISLAYLFIVTWITAFVMVIVHDRVPDMKKYPPLPDIFLDNVPHIPWAFDMCEVTGTILFAIWLIVLIFHKYRFFALFGTVFLLRCVTMLITSLSVPGAHLQCQPRKVPDEGWTSSAYVELCNKIAMAYVIWRGAGMSIQGVRTCGDYMFSGHTVTLTMLNFFITEYTPRQLYFLHTFTWMLNMFAFYITSRLFLYYHTLANNQALMQRDSNRTRIWFPLFSFFESSVDGIVPNEYESPSLIIYNLVCRGKDICNFIRSFIYFRKPRSNVNGHLGHKDTTGNKLNGTVVGWPDLLIDKKDKT
ncbi:sphingomyelin synthase-related 1 [Vespula squamosa]|uniref:Sphingomyelin synthase-related 1 n=1 Tax=Vespula squamosa TaxID=30214 RepID=A0ABD1ZW91_VESSQ